jgi:uncharacterized membrane protein
VASTAELLGLAEASSVSALAVLPLVELLPSVVEAGDVVGEALFEAGVAVAVMVISVAERSSVPISSHVSSVPVRATHESVDAEVSIEQEAVYVTL